MSEKAKGNMMIAQSGGPSAVINQSLVGAVLEARKQTAIGRIFGSLHGIKGVLNDNLIDLRRESPANLEAVAATPSSALGSVRRKPSPEDCVKLFEVLKRRDVRFFFYIGGNDSAETAHIINQQASEAGYELRCFHIPKTIDNDLRENDHTPGFGSAAQFVACAMMGIDLDNRALPGVHISVIMGRGAGFLTAASALARVRPDDGPHLVYLPERPFSPEAFVKDVEAVYGRLGRCMIAASEGIQNKDGAPIASLYLKERDSHGNVQLSGSGALGDMLSDLIKSKTKISRVRADTFGYLQRSFPLTISRVDAVEARQVGRQAVKAAVGKFTSGSVAIRRKPGKKYQVTYEVVPLQNVAKETRSVPAEFISETGNDVTAAFLGYARPLVGTLPKIGHLKRVPVPKAS
jgi:6-phosphofructokinase 1